MFSPGASTYVHVTRARLRYADGSERLVRCRRDPEDLTRFSHWGEKKVLAHESKVKQRKGRIDEAWGYCNLLSHRYAHNDNGSPLVRIHLYQVRIDYPEPGVDAHAWYTEQSRNPSRVYPDFYVFDVQARHGKYLADK
jgi:hypothetical protein